MHRPRQCVRHPAFGPVNLIKGDLADGFCRVWVGRHNVPKLDVAFPTLLSFASPKGMLTS
jgi:hypothetical protein